MAAVRLIALLGSFFVVAAPAVVTGIPGFAFCSATPAVVIPSTRSGISPASPSVLGDSGDWGEFALASSPSPLHITNSALPPGTLGQLYTATLTASGGTGTYTSTATGLPSGLTLTSSGGISGYALQNGTFHVGVTVHDAAAGQAGAIFTLTIAYVNLKSPDHQMRRATCRYGGYGLYRHLFRRQRGRLLHLVGARPSSRLSRSAQP